MYYSKDNNPMNKFNQYMKYKGHLERLYLSRSLINNKCPIIPSFLKRGLINKGLEIEKSFKVNNENNILYKHLMHILTSNSKYNPLLNIPAKCPAFQRKDKIQLKKYNSIIQENHSFYKILKKSKSTLDNTKIEKDFFNSRYYKNNISKNRVTSNPNLMFVTFKKFSNNCNEYIKHKYFNRTINNFDNIKKKNLTNHNKNIKINFSITFPNRNSSMGY